MEESFQRASQHPTTLVSLVTSREAYRLSLSGSAGAGAACRLPPTHQLEWRAASRRVPPSRRGGGAMGGANPSQLGCCSVERHNQTSCKPESRYNGSPTPSPIPLPPPLRLFHGSP